MIKAEWTNADALDLQPTCNQLATDVISRQAAIDLVKSRSYDLSEREDEWAMVQDVEELPSAQPEITLKDVEEYSSLLVQFSLLSQRRRRFTVFMIIICKLKIYCPL